jgi:signal transduction histidine kinase
VIRAMSEELSLRSVEVDLHLDPAIELIGDAAKFEQIIVMLISNALVHGFEQRDSGRIEIRTRIDGQDCVLEFYDDGQGITAEHLAKVLEPYYTTHFGKGRSGLGLYMINNVVTTLFGGQLSIDSRINAGTTVTMRFPLKPGPHRGAATLH